MDKIEWLKKGQKGRSHSAYHRSREKAAFALQAVLLGFTAHIISRPKSASQLVLSDIDQHAEFFQHCDRGFSSSCQKTSQQSSTMITPEHLDKQLFTPILWLSVFPLDIVKDVFFTFYW